MGLPEQVEVRVVRVVPQRGAELRWGVEEEFGPENLEGGRLWMAASSA